MAKVGLFCFPAIGLDGRVHEGRIAIDNKLALDRLSPDDVDVFGLDTVRDLATQITPGPAGTFVWRMHGVDPSEVGEDSLHLAAFLALVCARVYGHAAAPPNKALEGAVWATGAIDGDGTVRAQGRAAASKIAAFLHPECGAHLMILPSGLMEAVEDALPPDAVLSVERLASLLRDRSFWRRNRKVFVEVPPRKGAAQQVARALFELDTPRVPPRKLVWALLFAAGLAGVAAAVGFLLISPLSRSREQLQVSPAHHPTSDAGVGSRDPTPLPEGCRPLALFRLNVRGLRAPEDDLTGGWLMVPEGCSLESPAGFLVAAPVGASAAGTPSWLSGLAYWPDASDAITRMIERAERSRGREMSLERRTALLRRRHRPAVYVGRNPLAEMTWRLQEVATALPELARGVPGPDLGVFDVSSVDHGLAAMAADKTTAPVGSLLAVVRPIDSIATVVAYIRVVRHIRGMALGLTVLCSETDSVRNQPRRGDLAVAITTASHAEVANMNGLDDERQARDHLSACNGGLLRHDRGIGADVDRLFTSFDLVTAPNRRPPPASSWRPGSSDAPPRSPACTSSSLATDCTRGEFAVREMRNPGRLTFPAEMDELLDVGGLEAPNVAWPATVGLLAVEPLATREAASERDYARWGTEGIHETKFCGFRVGSSSSWIVVRGPVSPLYPDFRTHGATIDGVTSYFEIGRAQSDWTTPCHWLARCETDWCATELRHPGNFPSPSEAQAWERSRAAAVPATSDEVFDDDGVELMPAFRAERGSVSYMGLTLSIRLEGHVDAVTVHVTCHDAMRPGDLLVHVPHDDDWAAVAGWWPSRSVLESELDQCDQATPEAHFASQVRREFLSRLYGPRAAARGASNP